MNQCHECGEWSEDVEPYTLYLDGDICSLCASCMYKCNIGELDDTACKHERTDFDDTGRVFCLDCHDFMGVYR